MGSAMPMSDEQQLAALWEEIRGAGDHQQSDFNRRS